MSLKNHMNRLAEMNLTEEYNCLNTLQHTKWRINNKLLEVLQQVWEQGQEWGKLPPREDIPLPIYPFTKDPQEMTEDERKEFKLWSRKRNSVYSSNARSVSKRIQVERTLQVANQYAGYDEFYYVWQNDFRSRKYASATFLSPQSADWSKALLEFAQPMPINNWDDARWLCIHGANLYGNDKVTLDQREGWVWDNMDEFKRVVENPYDYLYWLEADKPWQFLAWCYEIVAMTRHGWGYQSRLPVSADGSCNGLQHLSAILRDERGGRATNLIPSDLPQDIYTEVAQQTVDRLKQEDTELARKCLAFGIDRKVTKRPVMIVPYSGTRHACRGYIQEALQERIKDGAENVFEDDCFEASHYLSGFVWDAIADVIQSARSVMDYVKQVGDVYADHKKHLEWVTPTNWIVVQQYHDLESKRIKTHINGEIVKISIVEDKEDTVNKRRTGLGSSPNFIHSLDAAAMTKTINRSKQLGIKDFAMVHDSYGTHSSLMPLMSDILRQEFVDMYEKHDVLQELRDHAIIQLGTDDIPHPPKQGNLNLANVLKSQYFFA